MTQGIAAPAIRPLVCFDCDGVLKDSERPVTAAFADQVRTYGLQITDHDAYARFKGRNAPTIKPQVQDMFSAQGKPVPLGFAHFVAESEDRIYAKLENVPNIPGAVNAVRGARALGFDVRVVTNSKRSELDRKFRNTEFDALVPPDHRHTADDVVNGKPAPDLYQLAARTQGTPLSHCIAVEDSRPGVQSASTAPMACIGVALESDGRELRAVGATHMVHDMNDVPATLKDWLTSLTDGFAEAA